MKTYEINITNPLDIGDITAHYVSTDADKMTFQKALDFVALGGDKTIDKVLVAVRVLGFKARELKVTAEEVFDL
jgi:sporulation-control protein spo0M